MRVAFVTCRDPVNIKSWSGTDYFLYNALKKKYEVEIVRPEISKFKWIGINFKRNVYKKVKNKSYKFFYDMEVAKYMSKQINRILRKRRFDFIFSPDSTVMALIDSKLPKIYLSDTTFKLMEDYYVGEFSVLPLANLRDGNLLEAKALNNADRVILPSKWAKESAVNHYGIKEEVIKILNFGANMQDVPEKEALKIKRGEIMKLLFVGLDWERKGGSIALDTYYELKRRGLKVELDIVGCEPEITKDEGIKIHGFLNKNIKTDAEKIRKIYLGADIFFLPTRAECAAIVYCEAAAFGLPSLATDTGGIPDIITNGVNGFNLPLTANISEYADKIEELYNNQEEFEQMRIETRKKYEEKLNWDVWLSKFEKIVEDLLPANRNI